MWPWARWPSPAEAIPKGAEQAKGCLPAVLPAAGVVSKSFIPKGGPDVASQSLWQEGKAVWGQAGKDSEGRPDQASGKQEVGPQSGIESVSRDTSVVLQARA